MKKKDENQRGIKKETNINNKINIIIIFLYSKLKFKKTLKKIIFLIENYI